jgi:NADPH2:quinone reductase
MTGPVARAVRFDRYGGREVLYVADIEMPSAGPGEVVVEVRAAGINPGEAGIRSGAMHEAFPATFPSGEGSDLAGVVTAVGPGVTEFSVGDEVLGFSFRRSSHATHTAVPVDQLIRKPAQLSWEVAGSLYVVGATAYAAVRAVAPQPGETVAVSAAAGGVGSLVVQLLACARRRCLASQAQTTLTGCAHMASPRSPTGTGWRSDYARRLPMASTLSSTCSARTTSSSPWISA